MQLRRTIGVTPATPTEPGRWNGGIKIPIGMKVGLLECILVKARARSPARFRFPRSHRLRSSQRATRSQLRADQVEGRAQSVELAEEALTQSRIASPPALPITWRLCRLKRPLPALMRVISKAFTHTIWPKWNWHVPSAMRNRS